MTDASGVQTTSARALHVWRAALAGAVIGLVLGSIPFAVDAYNEGRPYGYQIHRLPVWLKRPMLPGVFVAGEMVDWEAPTGGYLMQGCFATGTSAARGALGVLDRWVG